jgi:hypothetical protein
MTTALQRITASKLGGRSVDTLEYADVMLVGLYAPCRIVLHADRATPRIPVRSRSPSDVDSVAIRHVSAAIQGQLPSKPNWEGALCNRVIGDRAMLRALAAAKGTWIWI